MHWRMNWKDKMKIVVYDIAAEDGGGLFVLKKFYEDALAVENKNIKWFFLISNDAIKTQENVIVKKYETVKKNYIHRIIFERIYLREILKKINPDLVISLQNMPIKGCEVKQYTYLHQSLQYCPKKFSLLKSEERGLAFRQKVICNIYKKNLIKSDHIFVQTNWIKKATEKWLNIAGEKITVVPVTVQADSAIEGKYEGQTSRTFFYPARAEMYKNHMVVVEACKRLMSEGIKNFNVIFTIKKDDGNYAKRIINESKGLPIDFIGTVPYEKIWEYYKTTILLFPSYLETCGLPMLEAKTVGARILASDMPFSHENLDKYENARFFNYKNPKELAEKMKEMLESPTYTTLQKEEKVKLKSLTEIMLERV